MLLELSRQIKLKYKKELKFLYEKVSQGRMAEEDILKELRMIEAYLSLDHQNVELETKLLLCLNDDISSNATCGMSSNIADNARSVSCQTDCSNVSSKSAEKASQCVFEQKSRTFNSELITLHVEQRHPFKVSTVVLKTDMWGLNYLITGTLAHCEEHKYSKRCKEKMFRIHITNNKPNGSIWDVVGIKYKVHLHSWVKANTISKPVTKSGGDDISVRSSEDLILHSQLMDRCRNWVNREDNLKVSLEISVKMIKLG